MGKGKTLQIKRREPASPAQINMIAAKISETLLDFSDDESDRIMAAVSAANDDREALLFYAERIDRRAVKDGYPEPDSDGIPRRA